MNEAIPINEAATTSSSDIQRLIRSSGLTELRERLVGLRPPEIAALMPDLEADEQVIAFRVMGSMLPLVLRRLGFDPATSSAPFVATLVDVTGLVIYFSVGSVVLRGTLL